MLNALPDPDFPFLRGPNHGCDVCEQNKPTDTVEMFRDADGGWIGVCDDCKGKGA